MPDVLPGFLTGPFDLGTLPDVSEFRLKYVIVMNRIIRTIPKIIINRSWSVLVLRGKDSFSPDRLCVIRGLFLNDEEYTMVERMAQFVRMAFDFSFHKSRSFGRIKR